MQNKSDIDDIEKSILTASEVYVEVEKDSNGKDYLKEIRNGRKGLKIPLQILVNKGYVKKEDVNQVYKKYVTKLIDNEYFIDELKSKGYKKLENDISEEDFNIIAEDAHIFKNVTYDFRVSQ